MSFSTLLGCSRCEQLFQPTNKRHRFCSAKCRAAANYLPVKLFNRERKNAKFAALNRDRAIGFDGRQSGPENSSQFGDRILPRLRWRGNSSAVLVSVADAN